MTTPLEINSHVSTDPDGKGLSWSMDNADILTIFKQANAGVVTDSVVTKNNLMLGIAPAFMKLPATLASIQAKWEAIIKMLSNTEGTINIQHPTVAYMLNDLVSDGLLTQAERDAIGQRQGTYSEVAFGAGVLVDIDDIRAARDL